MARLNPTSLQFLQAFRELRKHDWPPTLDDLPTETVRYRLVRLRAVLIARGYQLDPKPVQQPSVMAPVPPLHGARRPSRRGGGPGNSPAHSFGLDRKRLSAGERDDD